MYGLLCLYLPVGDNPLDAYSDSPDKVLKVPGCSQKKKKIKKSTINILTEINSAQKELLHILGPAHSDTAVTLLPRWHNYLSKILWKTFICHLD